MNTLAKYFFLFAIGSLLQTTTIAQQFEFVENKGQWNNEVQYKGDLSAGAFFLKSNGYRVLQYKHDALDKMLAKYTGHSHANSSNNMHQLPSDNQSVTKVDAVPAHAYDVLFEGATGKCSILTEREAAGYSNYFIGNDQSKWATGAKTFGTVVYQNMYPGIDVRYYSENGFLKYDIIVHPGANLAALKLNYIGTEGLQIKNGNLLVKTSVGVIEEQYPYSYQLENGVRKEVKNSFVLTKNTISFQVKAYNAQATLVIDPTLIFSTFSGSRAHNWGYTATYDNAGNAYSGGIVFAAGYPVTTGAFQAVFGGGGNTGEGGFDIGIMKFNSDATQRLYATYLGGGGNEQPHSLVADGQGNLFIAGRTTSGNFPVTAGGLIGTGGLWDNTISKLNATGTQLIGSVRIGGDADDGVNIKHKYSGGNPSPVSLQQNYGDDARSEILLDRQGNAYVASCSRSANFPITASAFQKTLRGNQDALLMKFTPNLTSLLFATFLGGSSDDAGYVLSIEEGGDVLVAGGTASTDFPGDKSGTVGTSFQNGIADGFIARISSDGATLRKSVYIGTAGSDQVYGIQKDRNGFCYVLGTSTDNFPVRNATFSQPNGKQFIAKLRPDFSAYVYSTVFGSNSAVPNISPIAFLVDRCENVYVSGWGGTLGNERPPFPNGGTVGMTVTPDAIKPQTDGRDFYFFVMEKNATRQLYGSFFGQQDPPGSGSSDHVDGGTSRFDEDGIIYQALCANCSGGQFPITPGVIGPTNPSGQCNVATVKIAFDLSGIRTGIKSAIDGVDGDSSACVPATVVFRDTVALGKVFQWSFGDGSPSVTTSVPTVSHVYNAIGVYRVRLITTDPDRCITSDTSFMNIFIRVDKAPLNATATKLLPCASNAYRFDNRSTPFPGKPFKNDSFLWIFGDNSANVVAGTSPVNHQFPGPGTYIVKLVLTDTNYCNTPDTFSLTLRVSPNVAARFSTPANGCAPLNASFTNTSSGGTSFLWNFGDGTSSSAISPNKLYVNPGTYTVQLIARDTNACNLIDSTSFTISVSGSPNAAFDFSPNPPQENVLTSFTNFSSSAVSYLWLFGDGDSLFTIRRDTLVRHQYPRTASFNACLVATNAQGCKDTVCQSIPIVVNPLIDVATAFTPNNDGVNDRAVVFGFGVAKMTFRIYNRLGELVYENADPKIGWDGNYKGKPQPMDAYGFTLDAVLVDGTKVVKSGSITLIR